MLSRAGVWCAGMILVIAIGFPSVNGAANELDDYIEAQMRWRHIPGLSLAVVRDGHIVKAKGYGLANIETNTPAAPETVYKIGSLSKQFVAAATMLLVQRGKLDPEQTVSHFISDAPASWDEITVRHLLAHTSGLPREADSFNPFEQQPAMEIVRSIYAVPLSHKPGERWAYSNIGYYVLAEIITQVSGRPWSTFILEEVLAPAGLAKTVTADPAALVPHRASGYETKSGQLENADSWRAVRPSGGFATTVLDLDQWLKALTLNNPIVDSTRDQLFTPVTLNNGTTHPYAFGWFIDGSPDHRRVHHDGGVPGFSVDLEWFIDDSLAVIILTNIGNRDLGDIALAVAGRYESKLLPAQEQAIPDTEFKITSRIKRVLTDLAQGVVDTTEYTDQLASWLAEDLQVGFGDDLRGLGRIQGSESLEHRVGGVAAIRRYRFAYRFVTLIVTCTLDKSGKISEFSVDS